jgi:DNA polymerase
VLDRALEEAALDRARLYVTNAVKHFKHEQRGKRRLHKPPNAGEVTACKWWLNSERRIIRPTVTVALGATALSALAGPKATLKAFRGRVRDDGMGGKLITSYHPSFILRIPDEAGKKAAMAALIADLRRAAAEARK